MVIPAFKYSFYGLIIVIAIIVGMLFIYLNLKKDGYMNNHVKLYFILYIVFALVFGKIYTIFLYGKGNIITSGLSAYGGLIGVIISSFIFEKILSCDGKVIKYTIMSLPLVYSITKIACSISGCCSGILYDGIFKIKYLNEMNVWQFPIQILEVIVFGLIFLFCLKLKNHRNINYIVIFVTVFFKFLLDFLRYDHMSILITKNQIFSIFLIIVTVVVFIKNRVNIN